MFATIELVNEYGRKTSVCFFWWNEFNQDLAAVALCHGLFMPENRRNPVSAFRHSTHGNNPTLPHSLF